MRAALAVIAFAAFAAADPVPAGVSSSIAPQQSPPPGCSPNYDGTFQIAPVNVSTSQKRDLEGRQDHSSLGISLQNGVLTDNQGRTGYVAANWQFQFDDPPQAGAKFTAGFSICQNTTLALGNSAIWYRCLSGAGPTSNHDFYNLYLHDIGSVCIQSFFKTVPVGNSGPAPVPASLSTVTYASSSSAPANSSSSLSASTGGVPSNGTASVSSSSAASSSSSGSSPGGAPTGHTTGRGQTTVQTTVGNTQSPQTTGGGGGGAASSSSSPGAAAEATMRGDLFGLAAGVLAIAMF